MDGLGRIYSGNLEGIDAELEKSFLWLKRGAELGDKNAQYGVASCYLQGLGTSVDRLEGWRWMQLAAAQGSSFAEEALREKEMHELSAAMSEQLQRKIEENLRSQPSGSSPFTATPYNQYIPPQYREAQQK